MVKAAAGRALALGCGHRRLYVAATALAVVAFVGCGGSTGSSAPSPGPGPAVQNRQITFGGLVRSYRVYSPPTVGVRQRSALMVVLHGGDDSVQSTVDTTMFDRQAQVGNFIVAYPQGVHLVWNARWCCGTGPASNVDDVGFLSALLDHLEADYPIDKTRVFLTGVSNGSMLAYLYACEHADRVTAVGSVAGSMILDWCRPTRPVSVIEVHGTADDEVAYQGAPVPSGSGRPDGLNTPSTMALGQRWADLDGCPAPSAAQANGPVSTTTWAGCRNGSAVSVVSVTGGGHVWFAPGLGAVNGSLDATQVIWQFLAGLHPTS